MAELERALTQAGYIVSSWRALANDMTAHQVTAMEAAKKLGAEVLFQVNALERVTTPRGEGGNWNRTFYLSNQCGTPLNPAILEERDATPLRAKAMEREEKALQDKKLLGATLNVNAVMVETGQTIWFYQWTKFDTARPPITVRVLSQLTDDRTREWAAVAPQCSANYGPSSPARSTESSATGITPGSDTEMKNIYFRLMRAVVGDFVTRFAKSPGSTLGAKSEQL